MCSLASGVRYRPALAEKLQVGAYMFGHYGTEQRVRADVIDGDGDDLADEAGVAVEDSDPVVGRAAGELKEVAVILAAMSGAVAGAFDENFDPRTEELLAV